MGRSVLIYTKEMNIKRQNWFNNNLYLRQYFDVMERT